MHLPISTQCLEDEGRVTVSDDLVPVALPFPRFWRMPGLSFLGGTAAMIGPGAWSIDARLFGRKHIET
jgi:hypothetical protein